VLSHQPSALMGYSNKYFWRKTTESPDIPLKQKVVLLIYGQDKIKQANFHLIL
jgi:hypothetical protein